MPAHQTPAKNLSLIRLLGRVSGLAGLLVEYPLQLVRIGKQLVAFVHGKLHHTPPHTCEPQSLTVVTSVWRFMPNPEDVDICDRVASTFIVYLCYPPWNSLGTSCIYFREHKVNFGYPGTSLESNSRVALVQVFFFKGHHSKCKT